MNDILTEDALGTAAAARYLSTRVSGSSFGPQQIWRWMVHGAIAQDGQRIYLEHAKLGRKFLTSKQGLARFATRLARSDQITLGASHRAVVEQSKDRLAADGFF